MIGFSNSLWFDFDIVYSLFIAKLCWFCPDGSYVGFCIQFQIKLRTNLWVISEGLSFVLQTYCVKPLRTNLWVIAEILSCVLQTYYVKPHTLTSRTLHARWSPWLQAFFLGMNDQTPMAAPIDIFLFLDETQLWLFLGWLSLFLVLKKHTKQQSFLFWCPFSFGLATHFSLPPSYLLFFFLLKLPNSWSFPMLSKLFPFLFSFHCACI